MSADAKPQILSDPTLPIGLFDSGLGGLTVWRELRRRMPHESLIYFGDTARVPYGTKSAAELVQFVREIIAWMLQQPVKAIVMACNTSSALALEIVRSECPVPILGIILPGARAAVKRGTRVGVLATPATVASHAYRRAIQESSTLIHGDPTRSMIARQVLCWEQSCPQFVPLIESGQIHSVAMKQAARHYLQPLLEQKIDTLVYGCTHYPLLEPILRPLLPRSVRVVDPAVALVGSIARELDLWGLRRSAEMGTGANQFFVSGDAAAFADLAVPWLECQPQVSQIELQPVFFR